MKTTFNTLVNDIREFLEDNDPYEYRDAYETDADANADIADALIHEPEGIITYLAVLDDSADLIARIKKEGGRTA